MLIALVVDHGVLPDLDRRRSVPAGQPDQPGPAEFVHRHHGARHAARSSWPAISTCPSARSSPSSARLSAIMTGQWGIEFLARRAALSDPRRPGRCGAGLFDRLSPHSVLHRDACRHAGLPRSDAIWCSRTGRTSARSRRTSRCCRTGFIPDFLIDHRPDIRSSTSLIAGRRAVLVVLVLPRPGVAAR